MKKKTSKTFKELTLLRKGLLIFLVIVISTICSALLFNGIVFLGNLIYLKAKLNFSNGLENKDWFSFYGTALGGIIAASAIIFSYMQNEKNNKQLSEYQIKSYEIQNLKDKFDNTKQIFSDAIISLKNVDEYFFSLTDVSYSRERLVENLNKISSILAEINKVKIKLFLCTELKMSTKPCIDCDDICAGDKLERECRTTFIEEYEKLITIIYSLVETEKI